MNKLLEKRNTIYGVLAIWIIIFHTYRRISMPYIPVLTNVIGIGNMSVDVFIFFSGLCLSLSAKCHNYQKDGWGGYYRRRFARIIVPYAIICIPYYLWSAIFESTGGAPHKVLVFIANFSSASFWINGSQTTWYAYGIIIFYLLFPLLYSFLIKAKTINKVILIVGLIILAILIAYIPIINNSLVVWARLPIFTIGICAGVSSGKNETKSVWATVCAIIVFLLLGTVTSLSEISDSFTIPQIYRLLLYFPMTLSLLFILSLFNGKSNVLDWIGGLSLEVYLVHITLLHPLKYYGIIDLVGYWLYIILPVSALLISWIVGKIEKIIIKRLGV